MTDTMTRLRSYLAISFCALLAVPAAAHAVTLTEPANGARVRTGIPLLVWTLDANESSSIIETSRRARYDSDGAFSSSGEWALLTAGSASFRPSPPLYAGRHFWHVQADFDDGMTFESRWSNTRSVYVLPRIVFIRGTGKNPYGGWWGPPSVRLNIRYKTNLDYGTGALICKLKYRRKLIRTTRQAIQHGHMRAKSSTCEMSYPASYAGKRLRASAIVRGLGKQSARSVSFVAVGNA